MLEVRSWGLGMSRRCQRFSSNSYAVERPQKEEDNMWSTLFQDEHVLDPYRDPNAMFPTDPDKYACDVNTDAEGPKDDWVYEYTDYSSPTPASSSINAISVSSTSLIDKCSRNRPACSSATARSSPSGPANLPGPSTSRTFAPLSRPSAQPARVTANSRPHSYVPTIPRPPVRPNYCSVTSQQPKDS
uniref:Uncharacterized protein n=1 Tax=Ditylenchus dipsaci TaxID=166011 RepID=A0A915DXR1_9BILA